jgi:UDP-2,3-diacylglucosamine pyrophosphatase LpxH
MRKLLQYLFKKPLTWAANKFSGAPQKEAVFTSLDKLYKSSHQKKNKKTFALSFNTVTDSFIIFSDQHKGNKDRADDFANSEANYIAALQHYQQQSFTFISLGDSEEIWKYKPEEVIPKNEEAFKAEASFQKDNKYYRTFGNHDIIWKNKWDVERLLKPYFKIPMPVVEGVVLKTSIDNHVLSIFCTHGHQGDKLSDNNAISTWLVAHIWAPIQRYLQINVNTPSKDDTLRNKHNKLMYEWSSKQKNLLLITGHTHKPVFASGKYSNHPSNKINGIEHLLKPTYFNTGCCCFNDGDITGIEIDKGFIRLVKWYDEGNATKRMILEERSLEDILEGLK